MTLIHLNKSRYVNMLCIGIRNQTVCRMHSEWPSTPTCLTLISISNISTKFRYLKGQSNKKPGYLGQSHWNQVRVLGIGINLKAVGLIVKISITKALRATRWTNCNKNNLTILHLAWYLQMRINIRKIKIKINKNSTKQKGKSNSNRLRLPKNLVSPILLGRISLVNL